VTRFECELLRQRMREFASVCECDLQIVPGMPEKTPPEPIHYASRPLQKGRDGDE
jgi:hypothetical protein